LGFFAVIATSEPLQRKVDLTVIDGVLFDKDGTLFDFSQSWGGWAARLLVELATDADHAKSLATSIGFDPIDSRFAPSSPVVSATADEIATALLPVLPDWTRQDLIRRINALAEGAPMAEAVPLIPFLTGLRARGLRLGVATNDTEAPARAHLAAHGITGFFDFVAGYDSGHGAKPGPGMCLAFARSQRLDPARVMMVGDSLHDLAAGRAAGMRTVAVLTGVARRADLEGHADIVLADIGGLPDWIDMLCRTEGLG
jgi:phosphoglycolate phosphatase